MSERVGQYWASTVSHGETWKLCSARCCGGLQLSLSHGEEIQPCVSFPELLAEDFLHPYSTHKGTLQEVTDSTPGPASSLLTLLRNNMALPWAATQNVAQGGLNLLSSMLKVR